MISLRALWSIAVAVIAATLAWLVRGNLAKNAAVKRESELAEESARLALADNKKLEKATHAANEDIASAVGESDNDRLRWLRDQAAEDAEALGATDTPSS